MCAPSIAFRKAYPDLPFNEAMRRGMADYGARVTAAREQGITNRRIMKEKKRTRRDAANPAAAASRAKRANMGSGLRIMG